MSSSTGGFGAGGLASVPLHTQRSYPWRAALPEVEIHEVADVNHYTIVMGERGADAVADLVARRIAETHARSTG